MGTTPTFVLISSDSMVVEGTWTGLGLLEPMDLLTWAVLGATTVALSAAFAGLRWSSVKAMPASLFAITRVLVE